MGRALSAYLGQWEERMVDESPQFMKGAEFIDEEYRIYPEAPLGDFSKRKLSAIKYSPLQQKCQGWIATE